MRTLTPATFGLIKLCQRSGISRREHDLLLPLCLDCWSVLRGELFLSLSSVWRPYSPPVPMPDEAVCGFRLCHAPREKCHLHEFLVPAQEAVTE